MQVRKTTYSINDLNKRTMVLILLAPLILWSFVFKSFIIGRIGIALDTADNYALFKFFYNNLFNGVVPLWDPFKYLGHHYIGACMGGFLSPIAIFSSCAHFLGADYYQMYLVYIVGTYFIGVLGFYMLALEILESKFYASIAYVLLLFSGMGMMVFNQINIILIFVPSVWFFYFFFFFLKHYSLGAFAGMVLMLLIMSVSYFPFHFLTVLGLVLFMGVIVFFDKINDTSLRIWHFIKSKTRMLVLLMLIFLLGLLPALTNFMIGKNQENFFMQRHVSSAQTVSEQQVPSPKMLFEEISVQGILGQRFMGGRLLAHLDKFNYLSDDCFYVPVMAYLFVFLTIFSIFDRKRFMLLCLFVVIFLLSMGAPGHILRFFYDHFFIFKYFRNMFFFMAFLIPIIILFSVAQLKALAEEVLNFSSRIKLVVLSGGFHACFLLWAWYQQDILMSTYLTVLLSFFITICTIFGLLVKDTKLLLVIVLLLCIMEPVAVINHYQLNAQGFKELPPVDHVNPVFKYVRPLGREDLTSPVFSHRASEAYWYDAALKDSNGFIISSPDFVVKWPYLLWQATGNQAFYEYVHHKILLYDFIRSLDTVGFNSQALAISQGVMPVEGDSGDLKILGYDVNSVRIYTHFPVKRFLVYNDAYSSYWKVFIDGKEESLFRANFAFKGVIVPSGEHEIFFKYRPPFGYSVVLFIFIICGLTFWTVYTHIQERRKMI